VYRALIVGLCGAMVIAGIVQKMAGCSRAPREAATGANVAESFTAEQLRAASSKAVFFGHQSVGTNVIQGLRDLIAAEPRLQLTIVHVDKPRSVADGNLVEFAIGQNGDPDSKDRAFAAALRNIGKQHAVVMYKYCYVDMHDSTDAQQLFWQYHNSMSTLKAKYPWLTFVHVTMPLTTVEAPPKALAKKMLGLPTERDVEIQRNQFNELLRRTYQGKEPIFDLADAESTRPDGSRTYFNHGGRRIYTLVPEFTTDGGHLNEIGRCAVAARLLLTLGSI
jgi:hypothetical protein